MEVKHTPGPWVVTRGGQSEPFSIEASTRTVALVKSCRNEADANARLIAAAPDLLAACEAMLAHRFCFATQKEAESGFAQARAAIAKARGQ